MDETVAPGSLLAGLKLRINWDLQSLGGQTARKLTNYSITPLKMDAYFDLLQIDHRAANFGTGWTSDGKMYVTGEETGTKSITTIGYNTKYPFTTGFVKYTPIYSYVVAGSGVKGSIQKHEYSNGW